MSQQATGVYRKSDPRNGYRQALLVHDKGDGGRVEAVEWIPSHCRQGDVIGFADDQPYRRFIVERIYG